VNQQLDDHNSEVIVMYFRDIGTDVADYDEDESEPPLTVTSILRSIGGEVFRCAYYNSPHVCRNLAQENVSIRADSHLCRRQDKPVQITTQIRYF
jgi:hypothetical protein